MKKKSVSNLCFSSLFFRRLKALRLRLLEQRLEPRVAGLALATAPCRFHMQDAKPPARRILRKRCDVRSGNVCSSAIRSENQSGQIELLLAWHVRNSVPFEVHENRCYGGEASPTCCPLNQNLHDAGAFCINIKCVHCSSFAHPFFHLTISQSSPLVYHSPWPRAASSPGPVAAGVAVAVCRAISAALAALQHGPPDKTDKNSPLEKRRCAFGLEDS